MDPNPPAAPPPPPSLLPFSSFAGEKALGEEDAPGNSIRGRSIAERRAATCGFKAERINTARFRTSSPLASPAARSPRLTIPPGISPTALLDSPILLPNSQVSPTTGTFPLLLPNYDSSTHGDSHSDACSTLFPGFCSLENQGNRIDLPALVASLDQSMDFKFPAECSKEVTAKSCIVDPATDIKVFSSMVVDADISAAQMSRSDEASNQPSVQRECNPGEDVIMHHALEEQKETVPATGLGRTSEDGYNWRKYGQKQVKGSEYPRSYYKCTHPNCQVKKKIERSHDGQITEIIYKGAHNHLKPQPSRRPPLGSASSSDEVPEMDEGSGCCIKVEGGSFWRKLQPFSKDNKLGYDLRADGLERTSSASVVTELSDPVSATQAKSLGALESAGTPEFSSTLASHGDDDDEGATQGCISLGVEADDESDSKRRKIDDCLDETTLATRSVREPRVVVQIESEVDILDDGYRWRKYGQKVVKGNPNPRSYYKCTSAGCMVRKHVERASHNLKYVITTYEGKHNHEVPAARNSNNANSSGGSLSQATANGQPALALARNTNGSNPETQVEDFAPAFDRKPIINDYLRPNFPGSFGNEMKLGVSSIYPMKLPVMQNTMPYGSFGLNANGGAPHHSSSIHSLVLDFPMSLPSSLHTSANLSLAAAVDFNNSGKTVGQVQPFLSSQQLIQPKQERKDDSLCDSGLSIINHVNASSSSSSSVYQHIMGNFT